jgi:hypothetical protein
VIHSDSNKPMVACLQRETPLSSFDAVSTHNPQGSIPLYFIDDSIDDSQLLLVDQLVCVDLCLPHYDICPYWTYYMQDHFSVSHGSCLSPL